MVILGTWIGVGVLALLVACPLLILQCAGFRGCLRCGSELSDGVGKCLMCGQGLRTARRVFHRWLQRVCRLETDTRSSTGPAAPYHSAVRHSHDS